MSKASVKCDGCGRDFRPSGLTSHLKQTRNPPCVALYAAQSSYAPDIPSAATSAPQSPSPDSPARSPSPPPERLFAGDFFGEHYEESDFGWEESEDEIAADPAVVSGSDNDSDLEDLYWDPPPRSASPEEPDEDPQVYGDVVEDLDIPAPEERRAAENSTSIQVPHITKFTDRYPDSRAGQPVRQGEHRHSEYSAELADQENEWAPFSSKLDWEIAQWAKNRGPSSTAFTELLSIDGV
jgi:hypothetical protein